MYLLDTDHCVFLLRRVAPVVRQFEERSGREAYVSIITVGELLFGAYWSSHPEANVAETNRLLESIVTLPLMHSTMDRFGRIKADLWRRGEPIQDPDILIAATALEHDLTVVTHNTAHYERVPGLHLEDWFVM
jgi:tRNA(fMet)-specific endonuclease VapC